MQPGLISQQEKEKLWSKTKTKRSFYVGFLHAAADDLPVEIDAHPEHEKINKQLLTLIEQENPYAIMLDKVLSEKGQAFIKTVEDAIKKPGNQDVVISLLSAISKYFESIAPEKFTEDDIGSICTEVEGLCCGADEDLNNVVSALDGTTDNAQKYLCALIVLSCLSVKLVNPIFSRSDAIGTVMRKKIKPVTDPVVEQLKVLCK